MTTITSTVDSRAGHPGSGLRTALRLAALEVRLLVREPMAVVALIGFPAVMVLVIAGVFGHSPDPDFGGVAPDNYYVASYVGVVLASLGLITLPVHLATHRQLGVLRRFRAAGLGARTVVASQVLLGAVLGVVAGAIVLAVGTAVYGVTMPQRPLAALGWFLVGLACFIAIGLALGSVMRSSRTATGVGQPAVRPDVPARRWRPAPGRDAGTDAGHRRRAPAEPRGRWHPRRLAGHHRRSPQPLGPRGRDRGVRRRRLAPDLPSVVDRPLSQELNAFEPSPV